MGRRKKRMFLTMTVITAMSSALVAGVPRVADAAQLSVNAVKEKYVVVTDELGHKVKIPTDPKRVLAPKMEDSLVALGMTPIAQEEAGGLVQNVFWPSDWRTNWSLWGLSQWLNWRLAPTFKAICRSS